MVDLRLGWVTVAELLRQLVTVVGIVVLVLAGASLVPFLALAIPASLAAVAVDGVAGTERGPDCDRGLTGANGVC